MTVHPPKRRTNVSIEGALLDEARELGLNVSAVADDRRAVLPMDRERAVATEPGRAAAPSGSRRRPRPVPARHPRRRSCPGPDPGSRPASGLVAWTRWWTRPTSREWRRLAMGVLSGQLPFRPALA
jgi:hypothetical protein